MSGWESYIRADTTVKSPTFDRAEISTNASDIRIHRPHAVVLRVAVTDLWRKMSFKNTKWNLANQDWLFIYHHHHHHWSFGKNRRNGIWALPSFKRAFRAFFSLRLCLAWLNSSVLRPPSSSSSCINNNRNPTQSYGASPAIWNHTVLPATQHRWTRLAITPARQAAVLDLHTPEGQKAEFTLMLVINRDGLHVRRQSPIQVVTTS